VLGRRGRHGVLVAAVIGATALSALVAPGPAAAWHEEGTEITVDTAYTLPQGKVRLGIWRFDWGIVDEADVGTFIWPWIVPVPNLHTKLRVWSDERWALSIRTGLYYFDLDWVWLADTDSDATAIIFPLELWFSMPLAENWGLTVGAAWTTVGLSGTYDPDEFEGAAAVDNLQLALTGYWRLGRVVALLLTLRWLAYERARGDARINVRLDDFTTAEIVGAGAAQQESVRNAGYAMLSAVFSGETVNVRVGVGAGNYNIPSINLMIPRKTLVAELDLYFVF